MAILVIAANTLTRISRGYRPYWRGIIICRIYYEPRRQLAFFRGSILGTVSALLLLFFRGNVDSLIHLYAVGVFPGFQHVGYRNGGALVETRGKGWKTSIIINGADAILTTSI